MVVVNERASRSVVEERYVIAGFVSREACGWCINTIAFD